MTTVSILRVRKKIGHLLSLARADVWYRLRLARNLSFPAYFNIESTNACNLQCTMCPRNVSKRKVGMMGVDCFKKIIDEISPSAKTVILHMFGEPLLHPNIVDMVRYCKNCGIDRVDFSTNAMLLDTQRSEEVLQSDLDTITLCFDGASQETYETIRRGGDYVKVKNNILFFLEQKRRLGYEKPLATLQFICMKETEKDIIRFLSEWRSRVDRVWVRWFDTWAGQVDSIAELSASYHRIRPTYKRREPCYELWSTMNIHWDGIVVPCCRDYDGKIVLGNVKEASLNDLWNAPKYVQLRQMHIEERFAEIPLCARCTEWSSAPSPPHRFLKKLHIERSRNEVLERLRTLGYL